MKSRILVMNGSKILQSKEGDEWVNKKVDRANGLSPGFYNLFAAKEADPQKKYEGAIVSTDSKSVYQQVGKTIVAHPAKKFEMMPEVGSLKKIAYDTQGKINVSDIANTMRKGRTL